MKWISCLVLSFLIASDAGAYQFTSDFQDGFYWASLPIKILQFANASPDTALLQTLTYQAEAEWEDVVGSELWDFGGDFSENSIRWSNDFAAETGFDPYETLAITIRYQTGPYFTKTEIILNGSIISLRDNEDNTLYKTILHELGHTLGLDHSTEYAIMAPSINTLDNLQTDDIEGGVAIVDETLQRQRSGFVSNLVSQNGERKGGALGCGTIDIDGGAGPGPRSGTAGFILSLLFGFMLVLIFKSKVDLVSRAILDSKFIT